MKIVIAVLCLFIVGCQMRPRTTVTDTRAALPAGAEALSLFNRPLLPAELPAATKKEFEARLQEARAQAERTPDDPEAIIWLGRRTAYLGRYRDAIAIFSQGIMKFPDNAKLYRHRGHRYISVREFDNAIADLERAAALIKDRPDEVEPDGLPNARNIPTSTSHSNIWYHLGLAYYLKGDFKNALRCYKECLKFSNNPDMLVATTHWLYMTLRRLNRDAEADRTLAPIKDGLDIIENDDYYKLIKMYQGRLTPEMLLAEVSAKERGLSSATIGYGVANWYLYNRRKADAVDLCKSILTGSQWASFGYIAAEADLKGLGQKNF